MADKNDILSKVFRNRLKDYEHSPDADLWSKIEAGLPESDKGGKTPLWKWVGSVAAAAAILTICLIYFPENKQEGYTTAKKTIQSTQQTEKEVVENIQNPEIGTGVQETVVIRQQAGSYTAKASVANIKNNSLTNSDKGEKDSGNKETLSASTKEKSISDSYPESAESKNKTNEAIAEAGKKDEILPVDNAEKKHHKDMPLIADTSPESWNEAFDKNNKNNIKEAGNNKFSLALAVGNSGSEFPDFSSNNSMPMIAQSTLSDYYKNPGLAISEDQYNDVDYDYSIPISVGLSIRKYLSEKWAVESGITYTHLASKEQYHMLNKSMIKKDISLNYLGIPVKMVYSIINNNRFSMYVSGGGMVEKCISGNEKVHTDHKSNSNSVTISELQWSISGNAGLSYRLIHRLSIYVEPGVNYCFDDNSDVMTIRKDVPFNIQLQGGLRLTY